VLLMRMYSPTVRLICLLLFELGCFSILGISNSDVNNKGLCTTSKKFSEPYFHSPFPIPKKRDCFVPRNASRFCTHLE
jgi:hypothetical protein